MRILGIIILFLSLINTSILVFAYRELSLTLIFMFVVTLVGLPLGTHLLIKKPLVSIDPDSDEYEVKGLFTLNH